MSRNYLLASMGELFSFAKSSKDRQKNDLSAYVLEQAPVAVSSPIGGSAVMTGVAKYLETLPSPTAVAKYVKKKELQLSSGVEKYLLTKSINARQAPALTKVDRYITQAARRTKPVSGVSKYITQQSIIRREQPSLTGVTKYLVAKAREQNADNLLTGVAKYQAEQDKILKKQRAEAIVARYLAQEAEAKRQAAALEAVDAEAVLLTEIIEDELIPAATGVGRYLQKHEKAYREKPPLSGVAKYIAAQIVKASKQPIPSGVTRYMLKQRLAAYKKPLLTGVARYLEKQAVLAKTRPSPSGVSRYLIKQHYAVAQPKPPVKTGVSKYLQEQAAADSKKPALSKVTRYIKNQKYQVVPIKSAASLDAIEGEYLPAAEVTLATGVAKYIDGQKSTRGKRQKRKLTGVDKYLSKHALN